MSINSRRSDLPADTPFIREVWRRFRATSSADDFDRLCGHYLDLTRFHAHCIRRRCAPSIMFADLRGAANVGLVRAVRLFDPDGVAPFFSFSWGIIRRAICDELESLRPVAGRTNHLRRVRAANRVSDELTRSLERSPTLEEFAARAAVMPGREGSFARPPHGASPSLAAVDFFRLTQTAYDVDDAPDVEWIARARTPAPDTRIIRAETMRLWTRGMSQLERRVFVRFFLRGMLTREIAAELKLNRGTIHRTLTPLVKRLRADVGLARRLGLADYAPGDPVPNHAHLNRDAVDRSGNRGRRGERAA